MRNAKKCFWYAPFIHCNFASFSWFATKTATIWKILISSFWIIYSLSLQYQNLCHYVNSKFLLCTTVISCNPSFPVSSWVFLGLPQNYHHLKDLNLLFLNHLQFVSSVPKLVSLCWFKISTLHSHISCNHWSIPKTLFRISHLHISYLHKYVLLIN